VLLAALIGHREEFVRGDVRPLLHSAGWLPYARELRIRLGLPSDGRLGSRVPHAWPI